MSDDKKCGIDDAISAFRKEMLDFKIFMDGIGKWFMENQALRGTNSQSVHSVKSRIKDLESLKKKILRKCSDDIEINRDNIFEKITDLAGVRVLHLYQDQFKEIHNVILDKVNCKRDWYLLESPKAYTWDPESRNFFKNIGIEVEIKPSFYTSVHYLVKPRQDSPICCEIQVRTLFEEIWGEVDHALNYPQQSQNLSCREQLLVLAKLVGAGSRLVDSIFRSVAEEPEDEQSNYADSG